jgi:hypothetical protein
VPGASLVDHFTCAAVTALLSTESGTRLGSDMTQATLYAGQSNTNAGVLIPLEDDKRDVRATPALFSGAVYLFTRRRQRIGSDQEIRAPGDRPGGDSPGHQRLSGDRKTSTLPGIWLNSSIDIQINRARRQILGTVHGVVE